MRMTVIRGPVEAGPFELREGDNFAGRSPDCDLCLPSKKVSRRHATVVLQDGRVVVRDLESHNGVVDAEGRRVATLPLSTGGRVQIGDFLLLLEGLDAEIELDDDDIIEMEMDLDDADDVDLDEEEIPEEPARSRRPPPDPGSTGISPLARGAPAPKRIDSGARGLGRAARPTPPSPADLKRPDALPRGPAVEPRPAEPRPADPRSAAAAAARGESRSLERAPAVEKGFAAERPLLPPRAEPKVAPPLAARPAAAPVAPPAEGPVRAEDIVIRGLDDPPPGKPRKPKPEEVKIRGLDPGPSHPPRVEPPRVPPTSPALAPRPAPVAPRPMASAPSNVRAREVAPRPVETAPSPPRPGAPLPRFEPVEVPATGVPWYLQAVVLFGLSWAVFICTPFGGVLGQFSAADGRLDAATRAYAVQVATTLAARNALALATEDRENLDLSYATSATGVIEARVADSRGMVLSPPEKYRISLGNREVYQRAAQSLTTTIGDSAGGRVEIVVPARRTVGGEIVGWAWVEVDLDAMGAATAAPWWSPVPPLFATGFGSLLLLFTIWWLLLRPLSALAAGADRAMASEGGVVRPPVRLGAIERVATALNTAIGRARHGGG